MSKINSCMVLSQEQLSPLHEQHMALGAKMYAVNGWMLPLHFGSQIDEHHQVRKDCGVFDVSFMTIIDIEGKEAGDFLNYILANNIRLLEQNHLALHSPVLDEQGEIIDVLLVYLLDSGYRLICNNNLENKTINWINQQKQNFAVEVKPRNDLTLLSVQGPNAIDRLIGILDAPMSNELKKLMPYQYCSVNNWLFTRTGYIGEEGIGIVLPIAEVEAFWLELLGHGIMPIGMSARDTLRLEAGFNGYTQNMGKAVSPLAYNIDEWIDINTTDRKFIGQSAITKLLQERCQQKLVGLISEERSVLHNGQMVRVDGAGEGVICTTNFSPTIGKYIALARVPTKTGSRAEVEIKGKWHPVRVVSPRFVWQGNILV